MRNYLRILAISLAVFSVFTLRSFAEDEPPADLEKHKANAIANLHNAIAKREKKIQELQDDKSCISAATTTEAYNQCLSKREDRLETRRAEMKRRKGRVAKAARANRKAAGK